MNLGSIEFINSLPVDWGLLSGAVSHDGIRLVTGSPAELNDKILKNELDMGPVSAFWYAQHADKFLLLPDLSIGSQSGVLSVLVFSRLPLGKMIDSDRRIAITGKGRTTPVLLEILCRMRYGFKPDFFLPEDTDELTNDADALLLIGDEALEARERLAGVYEVTDLAEEWRRWTGLPFVFAVWAVRRDYFADHAAETMRAHELLLASKQWGFEHLDRVKAEAKRRTGLSDKALDAYFSVLSYELDDDMKRGMRRYFECAVECGLLAAVPDNESLLTGAHKEPR